MSESVGQAVLAGVRDLLPVLRERAQETEDAAGGARRARSRRWRRPGSSGCSSRPAFGGLEADPVTFLTARPADRQRLRVDRLGRLGARRAPLAARAVPAAGAGGGLGRRPGHPDVVVLRADRPGRGRRRRPPAHRPVELLLRLRPRQLGAARRDRARRRRQRRSTSARSCCPPATTRSTTSGTPSGCAAPAATTSWSTTRSCPSTAR